MSMVSPSDSCQTAVMDARWMCWENASIVDLPKMAIIDTSGIYHVGPTEVRQSIAARLLLCDLDISPGGFVLHSSSESGHHQPCRPRSP